MLGRPGSPFTVYRSRLTYDMPTTSPPPASWLHHLEDEADAAYLYRELAQTERDAGRANLYRRLADVEDRHVDLWRQLLIQHGHEVGCFG